MKKTNPIKRKDPDGSPDLKRNNSNEAKSSKIYYTKNSGGIQDSNYLRWAANYRNAKIPKFTVEEILIEHEYWNQRHNLSDLIMTFLEGEFDYRNTASGGTLLWY